MHHRKLILPMLISLALAGCGGGGGSSSTSTDTPATGNSNTTPTVTPQEQFPTGVTVSTPADLTSAASVTQFNLEPAQTRRQVADYVRAIRAALAERDFTRVAMLLVPISRAHATPSRLPEAARHSAIIEAILGGTEAPGNHIDWSHLTSTYNNANCFGPSIDYTDHDDGGGTADGTLPTGDLGMWTETSTDSGATRPCSVAQLRQLVRARKERAQVGMLIGAAMRKAVSANALTMPASGSSLDIATHMRDIVRAANPNAEVEAAVISRDSSTITYRLRVNDATAGQRNEILMKHRPDSSASKHSGVMLITTSRLNNDAGFGCEDQKDGSNYKVSWVQSVRYGRDGNDVHFSAREARYCGHGDTTQDNLAGTIAGLTDHLELDPAVKLTGNTRGDVKGWRGNFSRFAGSYDRRDHSGNFAYAWQAGTGDSHSRLFAAHSSFESVAESRAMESYFGYSAPIHQSNGTILGMICNWAGPGNSHTPLDLFQNQTATLDATDSEWTRGVSYIAYAPTNNCNATATMEFDVDASGVVGATEGNNTIHNLRDKGVSATVPAAISALGYVVPTLF